jgi:lipoprotein-anchoring transpeptidase ErfK/SrfK
MSALGPKAGKAQHQQMFSALPPSRSLGARIDARRSANHRGAAARGAARNPPEELPPQFRRTLVDYYTKQPAGTIVIDTPNTYSCILPLPFSPPITLRKVRA